MTNTFAPELTGMPPSQLINSIFYWINQNTWAPGIAFPTGPSLPTTGMHNADFFYNTSNSHLWQYQGGDYPNGQWVDLQTSANAIAWCGTSLPGSANEYDLFNKYDEGNIYQWIKVNGTGGWRNIGSNVGGLPLGADAITFTDTSKPYRSARLGMLLTVEGASPLLATDVGFIVKKDITAGGFVGTNQGEVWIGHGRANESDLPKVVLQDAASGFSTLYLRQMLYDSGSGQWTLTTPADLDLGNLTVHGATVTFGNSYWGGAGSYFVLESNSGNYPTLALNLQGHTNWDIFSCSDNLLYFAVSGTSPKMTLDTSGDLTLAGNLTLGNHSSASTATPVYIDLGATYSSTCGAHPKLYVYNDGTYVHGLGASPNQFDFLLAANWCSFNWYINGGASPLMTLDGYGHLILGGCYLSADNNATLRIASASSSVTIGAQNSSYIHFISNGGLQFYFNNDLLTTGHFGFTTGANFCAWSSTLYNDNGVGTRSTVYGIQSSGDVYIPNSLQVAGNVQFSYGNGSVSLIWANTWVLSLIANGTDSNGQSSPFAYTCNKDPRTGATVTPYTAYFGALDCGAVYCQYVQPIGTTSSVTVAGYSVFNYTGLNGSNQPLGITSFGSSNDFGTNSFQFGIAGYSSSTWPFGVCYNGSRYFAVDTNGNLHIDGYIASSLVPVSSSVQLGNGGSPWSGAVIQNMYTTAANTGTIGTSSYYYSTIYGNQIFQKGGGSLHSFDAYDDLNLARQIGSVDGAIDLSSIPFLVDGNGFIEFGLMNGWHLSFERAIVGAVDTQNQNIQALLSRVEALEAKLAK